jgi:hypothetical protein
VVRCLLIAEMVVRVVAAEGHGGERKRRKFIVVVKMGG